MCTNTSTTNVNEVLVLITIVDVTTLNRYCNKSNRRRRRGEEFEMSIFPKFCKNLQSLKACKK